MPTDDDIPEMDKWMRRDWEQVPERDREDVLQELKLAKLKGKNQHRTLKTWINRNVGTAKRPTITIESDLETDLDQAMVL